MTQPAPPPLDPGNQLLAETPAQLSIALLETPGGQRLALTIRTPSTTLTVLLAAADAKVWAGSVRQAADSMSSSGLIVSNGHITAPG
jgi:Tfp pilus assembly protein PilN